MAFAVSSFTATPFTTSWQNIMDAGDIVPGDQPSYQTCKDIFLHHPLGGKMAESPIRLAQSQERVITVEGAPERDLVEAFQEELKKLQCSKNILNTGTLSRVYGLSSLAAGTVGKKTDAPLNFKNIYKDKIF